MNQNRKYGFTIIELLAVILIITVIGLIATPIVINIIKESKESSILRSADFYLDAVKQATLNRMIDNKDIEVGEYKILTGGNVCLKYDASECVDELVVQIDGAKPISGTVSIVEMQKIGAATINFSDGTVEKDIEGNFVYIDKKTDKDNS